MSIAPDWAGRSGDAWTRRWRELDAALSGLAPQLHRLILDGGPTGPFRAVDIGCGAGSTTRALARDRCDAEITACDLSSSLALLAKDRLAAFESVRVFNGDAVEIAVRQSPIDLMYSRHGVMFFDDPVEAFSTLRGATSDHATLVFSCFQDWRSNPWASEVASAAAGRALAAPGREAGGFAFADSDYVSKLLKETGWNRAEVRDAPFQYVAGTGSKAVEQAMEFLSEIGPASRVLEGMTDVDRGHAEERMYRVIEQHRAGKSVMFPASAWLWSAT